MTTHKFSELEAQMSPERRARVDARVSRELWKLRLQDWKPNFKKLTKLDVSLWFAFLWVMVLGIVSGDLGACHIGIQFFLLYSVLMYGKMVS
jgi:hypothetical protein